MLSSLLGGCRGVPSTGTGCRLFWTFLTLGFLGMSTDVLAHAVAQGDRGYIQEIGVWGAMEPKTNVSSESHRKGAFRSPAHPPGITL